MPDRVLLQVPETCEWNSYVALAEQQLAVRGFRVIHPGLCRDELHAARPSVDLAEVETPDVVHLHWPEKLTRTVGYEPALALLNRLVNDGAVLVQTIHNLRPHEPAGTQIDAYLQEVDRLTFGVHFFSGEHELMARLARPRLPETSIQLAHPACPMPQTPAEGTIAVEDSGFVVGCFGRIRPYKRTAAFAAAFLAEAGQRHRLVVAGHPDDADMHTELLRMAAVDARLTYLPGFHSEHRFRQLIATVDWVALPYLSLWSSGVLVMALQMGRRVLCPQPVGAQVYGLEARGCVVEPWDDSVAVARWRQAATFPQLPPRLPTWDEAADQMAAFYQRLLDKRWPLGGPARRPGRRRREGRTDG